MSVGGLLANPVVLGVDTVEVGILTGLMRLQLTVWCGCCLLTVRTRRLVGAPEPA